MTIRQTASLTLCVAGLLSIQCLFVLVCIFYIKQGMMLPLAILVCSEIVSLISLVLILRSAYRKRRGSA